MVVVDLKRRFWTPALGLQLWSTLAPLMVLVDAVPTVINYKPQVGEVDVPVVNFPILLEFNEVIQAGIGSISMVDGGQGWSRTLGQLTCNGEVGPQLVGTFALVPMYIVLGSEVVFQPIIPANCFLNKLGQPMAKSIRDYYFTTMMRDETSQDDNFYKYDVTSPRNLDERLMSPQPGSYLDEVGKFTIYFNEAVQLGIAPIYITQTRGDTTEVSVFDNHPKVVFDDTMPGKVYISSTKVFKSNCAYELRFDGGAIMDVAGNLAERSSASLGVNRFDMRVTSELGSTLAFVLYPKTGYVVKPDVHLLFRFNQTVTPGDGVIKLCYSNYTLENPCGKFLTIGTQDMIFLDKLVIVNPPAELNQFQVYNVSIPGTVFNFFEGVSYNSKSEFYYSFRTWIVQDNVDNSPPVLLRWIVDCNANGRVLDACDCDGDGTVDFVELVDSVTKTQPMTIGARFLLFFDEQVRLSPTITMAMEVKPENVTMLMNASIGVAVNDCVVTLEPVLLPGREYTLIVPPGAILDMQDPPDAWLRENPKRIPPWPNVYSGMTVQFFIPMQLPSVFVASPTNANVAETSLIRLDFVAAPVLNRSTVLNRSKRNFLTLVDVGDPVQAEVIDFEDTDKVKSIGTSLVIFHSLLFRLGRTYLVFFPKFTFNYQTLNFSYNFTIRQTDHVKPRVVLTQPTYGPHRTNLLNTIVPMVLFSESVLPNKSRRIVVYEDTDTICNISADDSVCGVGGSEEDSCVVLDNTLKRLALYPRGILSNGRIQPWTKPNKTYTVVLEASSFTDAPSSGDVFPNYMDESTFTFKTLLDETPLKFVSSIPAAGDAYVDPSLDQVTLTFDKAVLFYPERGDGIYVKAHLDTGDQAPRLLLNGPNAGTQTTLSAETGSTIVALNFDTLVQAGAGGFELYNESGGNVDYVSAMDSTILGTTVFLSFRNVLPPAPPNSPEYHRRRTKYFLRSAHEPIRSARSGRSALSFDTGAADSTMAFVTTSSPMTVLHSTFDEYACLSTNLHEIELYMSKIIVGVNALKTVSLRSCPYGNCDMESTPSRLRWSINAGVVTRLSNGQSGNLSHVTLSLAGMPALSLNLSDAGSIGGYHELVLEDGLFTDTAVLVRYAYTTTTTSGSMATMTTTSRRGPHLDNTSSNLSNVTNSSSNATSEGLDGDQYRRIQGTDVITRYPEGANPDSANWLYTYAYEVLGSPQIRLPFRVCEVCQSPSEGNVITVYGPFGAGPSGRPRSFQLMVSEPTVQDDDGNELMEHISVNFSHDKIPPTLDVAKSKLVDVLFPESNVVLTFNEEVRPGQGSFQFWEYGTNDTILRWSVDVASVAASSLFFGRTVVITPHRFCSNMSCDFPGSSQYYVTANKVGVLLDSMLNSWDASSAHILQFFVSSDTENISPSVLGVVSRTWRESDGSTLLRGFVYINYRAVVRSLAVRVESEPCARSTMTLCGFSSCPESLGPTACAAGWCVCRANHCYDEDYGRCMFSLAQSIDLPPSDFVAFPQMSFTESFDTLGFVIDLPNSSHRFKITIFSDLLQDPNRTYIGNPEDHIMFVDTGACLQPPILAGLPRLLPESSQPQSGTLLRPVYGDAVNEIILAFSEELFPPQDNCTIWLDEASHLVRLCVDNGVPLSSSIDESMRCVVPGLFADGTEALIPWSTASVQRRLLRLPLPKALRERQNLRLVMQAGLLANRYGVLLEGVGRFGEDQYRLVIKESDIVPPLVDYYSTPFLRSDHVTLVFSEAVQFAASVVVQVESGITARSGESIGIVGIMAVETADFLLPVQATIEGNYVSLFTSWGLGFTYSVWRTPEYFADLAGNIALSMPEPTTRTFTISADTEAPRYEITPAHLDPIGLNPHDSIVLSFGEVVQAGTGTISVYTVDIGQSCNALCGNGEKLFEVDVQSLPMAIVARDFLGVSLLQSVVSISFNTGLMPPGRMHSVSIPATAFSDLSGNHFEALASFGTYEVIGSLRKDLKPPSVAFIDIGAPLPNKGFSGTNLVVYFTEVVQVAKSPDSKVLLLPSDGGENCGFQHGLDCLPGEICGYPCNYVPADEVVDIPDESLNVTGLRINVSLPTLERGRGYQLWIDAGKFADVTGNPSVAFDGSKATMNCVFRTSAPMSPSDLPEGLQGASIVASRPSNGDVVVPLSTTLVLSFSETVQAGSAPLLLQPLPSSEEASSEQPLIAMEVDLKACIYVLSTVICTLPDLLLQGTSYKLSVDTISVLNIDGTPGLESNSEGMEGKVNGSNIVFTTIDADYKPPRLAALSGDGTTSAMAMDNGGAFLPSAPFVPPNGSIGVPKGTLVSLTFDEVVQAGFGGLVAVVRSDIAGEDGLIWERLDVQRDAASRLSFNGPTVYAAFSELGPGKRYEVRTDGIGVFRDTNANPAAELSTSFEVLPADSFDPKILLTWPLNDTARGNAGVTASITLYFSEAVQATHLPMVLASSDGQRRVIPVDNSNPVQGTVRIDGVKVVIDPYGEFGSDVIVGLTIPPGTFLDLYGQPFAGWRDNDFRYRTIKSEFKKIKGAKNDEFAPREGPIIHYLNDTIFLFGGSINGTCLPDTWTSRDGVSWESVQSVESTDTLFYVPTIAYGPTASDKWFCMYLLGGYCSRDQSTLWRTCDGGGTWNRIPQPVVVPWRGEMPPPYPTSWHNHAMVIVSGWQLLIIDAADPVNGGIWRFIDEKINKVQKILQAPLPFRNRRDPQLVSTTENFVYLFGGHNCDYKNGQTSQIDMSCNAIFMDLWMSSDVGVTWLCQTAHYAPALWTPESEGPGHFAKVVSTHDDYIFVLGGVAPWRSQLKATNDSGNISTSFYSSFTLVERDAFDAIGGGPPYICVIQQVPPTFTFVYRETILAGSAIPQITDAVTGRVVQTTRTLDRQKFTIQMTETLVPGRTYKMTLPDAAAVNMRGTIRGGNATYGSGIFRAPSSPNFSLVASTDVTPPWLRGFYPPEGMTGVPPWTNFLLNFSEPVLRGAGQVLLTPRLGPVVALDIALASHVSNALVLSLPSDVTLVAGQTYVASVPAGIVRDQSGNMFQGNPHVSSFTVLSWILPSDNYMKDRVWPPAPAPTPCFEPAVVANLTDDNMADASESDIAALDAYIQCLDALEKPQLLSLHPQNSSTDVNFDNGVAVVLFYDRQVTVGVGSGGPFIFINGTSSVRLYGRDNLIDMGLPSDALYVQALKSAHAVRIVVPPLNHSYGQNDTMLKPMTTYKFTIPKGFVRDLKGREADAVVFSFTTLFSDKDLSSPIPLMTYPQGGVFASSKTPNISIWYSESVQQGIGDIVVVKPVPRLSYTDREAPVAITLTSKNLIIEGARVTIAIQQGTLVSDQYPNPFTILIPAGAFKDLLRIVPRGKGLADGGGGNPSVASSLVFSTWYDDFPPRLIMESCQPPNEQFPSHQLPVSLSFTLLFSEVVQAGEGNFRLQPRYNGPEIVIPASKALLTGQYMAITPPEDVLPGQIYSVVLDANAIYDVNMNTLRGLSSPYLISTARRMDFRELNRKQWSPGLYGFGAIVSAKNEIFTIGGKNSTLEDEASYSSDVWTFGTLRDVNCGVSFMEVSGCSLDVCAADERDAGGFSLGEAIEAGTIYRSPTPDGRQCPRDPNGQMKTTIGDFVGDREVVCPCPICIEPPRPPFYPEMPEFMINLTYVDAYVDVPASGQTRPLLCEQGRSPTGDFVCVKKSRFFGGWKLPFPSCENTSCVIPPNLSAVDMMVEFDPIFSTKRMDCAMIDTENPMPHGGECTGRCAAGWFADGNYVCNQGNFIEPSCQMQSCPAAPESFGTLYCFIYGTNISAATFHPVVLGTNCSLVCGAGFTPSVLGVECSVVSEYPEEPPTWFPLEPVCSPSECGAFPYTEGTSLTYKMSEHILGDEARSSCADGYVPWGEDSLIVCGPLLDLPGEPAVGWLYNRTRLPAGPLCVLQGRSIEENVQLVGAMDFYVDTTTPLSKFACRNATFERAVTQGLAGALSAASSSITMPVLDVTVISSTACPEFYGRLLDSNEAPEIEGHRADPARPRRMAAAAPRNRSGEWIEIGFFANCDNKADAEAIRREVATPIKQKVFERVFSLTFAGNLDMGVWQGGGVRCTQLATTIVYKVVDTKATTMVPRQEQETTTRMTPNITNAASQPALRYLAQAFATWMILYTL